MCKSAKFARPARIKFTESETFLIHYLSENKEITLKDFMQLAHIGKRKAEAILVDTILVIQTSQGTVFRLNDEAENI